MTFHNFGSANHSITKSNNLNKINKIFFQILQFIINFLSTCGIKKYVKDVENMDIEGESKSNARGHTQSSLKAKRRI